MTAIINRSQVASKRTGEIYYLAEYEDGRVTCTCAHGSMRGPMQVGDRACWHVRKYRIDAEGSRLGPVAAPSGWTPGQPLDVDMDEWMRRFARICCPVNYMLEIVTAIIRWDDIELGKVRQKAEGKKNLRPKPMPQFSRVVIEELRPTLVNLVALAEPPVAEEMSEADAFAYRFLLQALAVRDTHRDVDSNQDLAWQIHRWMVGSP